MSFWLNKKFLISLLIGGLVFFAYKSYFSGTQEPKTALHAALPAMPVSVAQVLERDIQHWNEYAGYLVAAEQVEIRPRVAGSLERIHFTSGAFVKKGDPLFTLDQRPFQAELARAQGAFASAKAQVQHSANEYARAKKLIQDKVISESEFDSRRNAFDVNTALLESAKAVLETATINLDHTLITSPITGRISRAEITLGNLVQPGDPLLATVVSDSPIYVDFDMDERTFLKYLAENQTKNKSVQDIPVKMVLASENGPIYSGYIESFDNHLNSKTGTIRVRAIFKNEQGRLLPGLFARIKLGNPQMSSVILITDRAIGTDQDKKYVLVIEDSHKVAYREIKLGATFEGLRIVKEGLHPGEKIVVNGLQRARPGMDIVEQIVPMAEKELS